MDRLTDRRGFLAGTAGAAGLGIVGRPPSVDDRTGSHVTPETTGRIPETIGLEAIVDGLDAPLAVAFVPDADRRYVAERDGRILLHGESGLRDDPVLDLRDSVETDGEQGLLGMALHPDFSSNGRLFVRYSASPRAGMAEDYSHTFVLAEFEVTDDGTRARRDSERTILEIPEPTENHNGGDLAFGPDGYLYAAVGDSGRAANGQNVTENLLGSILRLDVDSRPGRRGYVVPDDNPLIGRDGLDEYYAWGFRNPWRISFDGDEFYVADVGQNEYEEVNLVEAGGNYGWNDKEGTYCRRADACPDETPDDVRDGEPLLDPIVEYPHESESSSVESISGVSIIGGYVYRGSTLAELDGSYVFGDFIPDGRLFVAERSDGDDLWPTAAVPVANDERVTRILSFGRDEDGEVYVLGTGSDGGGLFRLDAA